MTEEKQAKNVDTERRQRFLVFFIIILAIFGIGFLGGYIGSQYGGDLKTGLSNIGQKTIEVKEDSAIIDAVAKVKPGVVSITAVQDRIDFFGRVQQSEASGTGFIVSADGLIITNKHVISGGTDYSVFTSDGKEYKATIKAQDPMFDIAILKVNASGLTPVEFGDSDSLVIGQRVIAIGNALGQFQNTVTTGVVSAIGRAIEAGDSSGSTSVLDNLIQTDAAINSGNSGGPLINVDGQVIGINTAVAQGAEGIGFAIPANVARTALISYEKSGKISRPMIGVRYINITKEFAARNNLPVQAGALLYSDSEPSILVGSPAATAGLKENDIITKVGNDKIGNGKSLVGLISKYQVGEKVTITYLRDGKERTVEVTLAEAKS